MKVNSSEQVLGWLLGAVEPERKAQIWNLGLLTGWRRLNRTDYGPANFERALVLHRLGELLRPPRVLEIGTGRGLGSFSLAAAAQRFGYETSIDSVDFIPDDQLQPWARQIGGRDEEPMLSRNQAWRQMDDGLRSRIQVHVGSSTGVLPRLYRNGNRYNLIFVDAGHDLYSVMHDLVWSARLLEPGGVVLMDDFAPLEDFGIGTCIAVPHARMLFRDVVAFPTEGLVYGNAAHPTMPRGMVLLQELQSWDGPPSSLKMAFWRLLSWLLQKSYTSKRLFALR